MTNSDKTTAFVTRFDVREGDGGTEVRLFAGRVKLVGFEFDGDIDDIAINAFIAAKPRTAAQVMDLINPDEAEDEGDEAPGSIVPEKYRLLYGSEQNCGDGIARTLSNFVTEPRTKRGDVDGGLNRAALRGVAEFNGIADKLAIWEDHGLNGGLLRMNTSNVLRGMQRRGEGVTIGSMVWPAFEVEKKARKARAPKTASA